MIIEAKITPETVRLQENQKIIPAPVLLRKLKIEQGPVYAESNTNKKRWLECCVISVRQEKQRYFTRK